MPLGWLHVNGVSLSTDIHQQGLHTSESRSKHVTSPIPPSTPPLISSPNSFPFMTSMNDAKHSNRYYQKLDNGESPKKIFIDRQIQKVKSLPGLIKGTALCHHASLSSTQNANPINSNSSNNNAFAGHTTDNDDDSSPSRQYHDRTSDGRRPRVSFSDFNKIQFYEGNNELSQQATHRRHRHRGSRKPAFIISHNQVSPPSIQQSQALHIPYRPSSRQQQVGQELNIKKQLLVPSPRGHSSRIAQLPDILNQSLPADNPIHERYTMQRDRGPIRLPEATMDVPINSSAEISRESTRAGGIRSSALQEYQDQAYRLDAGDPGTNSFLNSSSLSSSLSSRQRSLRSISLRQQFISPTKSKLTITPNSYQSPTNPRRSASLKHLTSRFQSIDDENEDLPQNGLLSASESRPMTGLISSRQQMKNNYIIHFNPKTPYNGNTIMDSPDKNRQSVRSNFNESSQERFQNVLKIVRPPCVAGINSSNNDSKLQSMINNPNGSVRSSRTNSGHGTHEFHITSNTIFV